MGNIYRFILVMIGTLYSSHAHAACRQALVLAIDISGSVSEFENAQQFSGLAGALLSPNVRQILLSDPNNPVAITVFAWSSFNHQTSVHPWTEIRSIGDLLAMTNAIRGFRKDRVSLRTAIGSAVQFAGDLLDQKKQCAELTIDVSGDGTNNAGPLPKTIYAAPRFNNITVNALVVSENQTIGEEGLSAQQELRRYYQHNVIWGPSAFAMVAEGYADYARAMEEKLIRELSGMNLSYSAPPTAIRVGQFVKID